MEVHRGEVFYADLSPVVGSEQGGIRPVLIIQNEIGNRHSPTVIAAAITSRQDKNRLPTHISVRADRCGLAKDSIILTEQIPTLEAVRAYTSYAALFSHSEAWRGTIEPGKVADFVIPSEDILEAPAGRLKGIAFAAAIVDNRVVHGQLP